MKMRWNRRAVWDEMRREGGAGVCSENKTCVWDGYKRAGCL